jgi:hypothetical protein
MDETPDLMLQGDNLEDLEDEVVVLRQGRGAALVLAVLAAACALFGAWQALVPPDRLVIAQVGFVLFLAGAAACAVALVGVLKPAQIIIAADGLDYWAPLGARSAAWEEVAAIGYWYGPAGRILGSGPLGVRIVLAGGAGITLPGDWSMAHDALLALLVEAWQQFTTPAKAAPPTPWGKVAEDKQ